MFEILTNSLSFFLHFIMMKHLSKDGTTMFLLSHIMSFPPLATQRIKENQGPLNQSSSKLQGIDKSPPTEWWALHRTRQPHYRDILTNNDCQSQPERWLPQPLMKKSQTSNSHVERKEAHLKYKEAKTTRSKSSRN